MVGVNYQISTKALKQIIDASKEHLSWAGFAPVSPDVQEKIRDAKNIVYTAMGQANDLKRRMRQIVYGANKRYVRQVAGLLKQSTGVPVKTVEEFVRLPEAYLDVIPHWRNSEFETELRSASEIKLEAKISGIGSVSKLVHCPRLEAKRITCRKGRFFDYKMLEALKNQQGFAITLYAPTPQFSKNYKMLKDFANLEQLAKQSAI